MKLWNRLNLRMKYAAAFSTTILLITIVVLFVALQLNQAKQQVDQLENSGIYSIEIAEMASLARTKDIRIADYIREPRSTYVDEFNSYKDRFTELQNKYVEIFKDTPLSQPLQSIIKHDREINQLFLEEIVGNVSNQEKIQSLRRQTQFARSTLVEELSVLQSTTEKEMKDHMLLTNKDISRTLVTLIIGAILALVVGVLFMRWVSRQIQARLNQIVNRADSIASGRLDEEFEKSESQDEIGHLHNSMNQMQLNLQALLLETTQLSDRVSQQSRDFQQSSKEVQESSEQVAATMEELAASSEQQAGDAATLNEMMEQLSFTIEQSKDTGIRITDQSQQVMKQTDHGQELMDSSVTQMNEIHDVIKSAVEKVQQLDLKYGEITKLVHVIQEIAERTNLLALNAAIEAARAGDHGRGFAVVADEVRKLSEQVSHSVEDITQRVEDIQSGSREVSGSLKSGFEQVEIGKEKIQYTGHSFEEIQKSIFDMVEGISEISENLNGIHERTQTMNEAIESVAASSEEAAAGVEETTAATQQTNHSMLQVSNHSQELSEMALRLKQVLSKFQLNK
ncbi:methyl-accepting chemotaxis protein [Halobacillus yeomjeoni]|uniref:HAMP domain-containing protein n=1 Tax=Halobacillus yeomjeoni TaxID=311194 RepID=A0A931HW13_9BACI|nr:HAMP domain-containing methyl-accepting chemotaxis protein [Halobacillus yeomjeoni]MBH0230528.1 HAMP domain-containing protein [Halobacillus yeomjeoni]